MYSEGKGSIHRDKSRLTNFTLRISRYEDDTDTLHGTIRVGPVTRRFTMSASGYRDDLGLAAALAKCSQGTAEFYGPVWRVRGALDLLAFPA